MQVLTELSLDVCDGCIAVGWVQRKAATAPYLPGGSALENLGRIFCYLRLSSSLHSGVLSSRDHFESVCAITTALDRVNACNGHVFRDDE